jgi:hypothetical protein
MSLCSSLLPAPCSQAPVVSPAVKPLLQAPAVEPLLPSPAVSLPDAESPAAALMSSPCYQAPVALLLFIPTVTLLLSVAPC